MKTSLSDFGLKPLKRGEDNNVQRERWKTRLVGGEFPDRLFDVEFWQEQGDEAIFAAAWELVELAEETSHGGKPTLQKTLQFLNEFQVEYLIVGGFAVMKYGEPRYTKDLDVWVHNRRRIRFN